MNTSSQTGFIGQSAWAAKLGVSVRTFRRWRESGLIPIPDCIAPGHPRWSVELVERTKLRRRNGALKSHASRFQQSSRSLHGAGVSGELVSDVHAAKSAVEASCKSLPKTCSELHQ